MTKKLEDRIERLRQLRSASSDTEAGRSAPISSSRRTEAIEFLLDLAKTGSPRQAKAASEALEIHKDSPEILSRLKEAPKGR